MSIYVDVDMRINGSENGFQIDRSSDSEYIHLKNSTHHGKLTFTRVCVLVVCVQNVSDISIDRLML